MKAVSKRQLDWELEVWGEDFLPLVAKTIARAERRGVRKSYIAYRLLSIVRLLSKGEPALTAATKHAERTAYAVTCGAPINTLFDHPRPKIVANNPKMRRTK